MLNADADRYRTIDPAHKGEHHAVACKGFTVMDHTCLAMGTDVLTKHITVKIAKVNTQLPDSTPRIAETS